MSAAADVLELDINIQYIPNILIQLLNEITPNDYVGYYPPQQSYADEIKDSELMAFQWLSKRLGCKVYLNFTIKENQLWLVSLHRARKMRKE